MGKTHPQLKNNSELSIYFTHDNEIKALNNKFRKINKPTDVLSFPLNEGNSYLTIAYPLLGDIVISLDTAIIQARTKKHSLHYELKILIIHGLLHLFGYDHYSKSQQTLMNTWEIKLLEVVNSDGY